MHFPNDVIECFSWHHMDFYTPYWLTMMGTVSILTTACVLHWLLARVHSLVCPTFSSEQVLFWRSGTFHTQTECRKRGEGEGRFSHHEHADTRCITLIQMPFVGFSPPSVYHDISFRSSVDVCEWVCCPLAHHAIGSRWIGRVEVLCGMPAYSFCLCRRDDTCTDVSLWTDIVKYTCIFMTVFYPAISLYDEP